MHRLFRLSILVILLSVFGLSEMYAVNQVKLTGSLPPGDVRIFLKDSTYLIDGDYIIGGTLIIEPGTTVLFGPNSRIIDSVGGRIIADGFASARYTANPNGEDPNVGTCPDPWRNPISQGYATLNYFTYEPINPNSTYRDTTIAIRTIRDLTVNPLRNLLDPFYPVPVNEAANIDPTYYTKRLQYTSKENYVYNVLLNKTKRKIMDFQPIAGGNGRYMVAPYDPDGNFSDPTDEIVVIPFEKAIMFAAARLYEQPSADIKLRINPWKRVNGADINLIPGAIQLKGQPVNDVSREYGHIVVLPGARAAFFRNCTFEGFKKDTTVDRFDYYKSISLPQLNATQLENINKQMRLLSNGTGGAIASFSSRLWLLDCKFQDNFARHRGGAVALMQSPDGFPNPMNYYPKFYRADKNPALTNTDGTISSVNSKTNAVAQVNPQIDLMDEKDDLNGGTIGIEFYNDFDRQAFDDARVAVLLGRVRNVQFLRNRAQLANVGTRFVGQPPQPGVFEVVDQAATAGREYGDVAFGGALYISGKGSDALTLLETKLEIGLGVNNQINVFEGTLTFPAKDTFLCRSNRAYNYQVSDKSFGARGGAVYVGKNTSLVVAGKFLYNQTNSPFMQDPTLAAQEMIKHSGRYSKGGAIFLDNTEGRLQVRGGPFAKDELNPQGNNTLFLGNKSASGGAIYVAGVKYRDIQSPVIGGSDQSINTRNYGFNIKFQENTAVVDGGAIYTERNTTINGAGGLQNGQIIGYGGNFPINFENNRAGYSGGAVKYYLPEGLLNPSERVCEIIRAEFIGNEVGNTKDIIGADRPIIAGGGAIYSVNADLNLIKATLFKGNKVYDGNGGAIALISPLQSTRRYILTDLDVVSRDGNNLVNGYTSKNEVFANSAAGNPLLNYPADERMLTRFYDNEIIVNQAMADTLNGGGATQIKSGPQETNASFLAFSFIGNTGFAVGSNGAIIKLVNGIKNSQSNYQNQILWLRDVHFTSANIGYAVGDNGLFIKTTDAGLTWTEKITHTTKDLHSVSFANDNIAYVVGVDGIVLKTTDAGETWNTLTQTATTANLRSVKFVSPYNGVAVGDPDPISNNGAIIVTKDGGATWALQNSLTLSRLNDVEITTNGTAYVVGTNGVILKSTTQFGIGTWVENYFDLDESFNAISVLADTVAWVVGDHGSIYKSGNGTTWTKQASGTTHNIYSVKALNLSEAFAGSELGLIIKTVDGGTNWTIAVPINTNIADVKRYHPNIDNYRLPENGIGLGGALYILDVVDLSRLNRIDTVQFNRVRIQNNKAFSGAAVYSDNFNLHLVFQKSLITGNEAYSTIGKEQNYISGPLFKENANKTWNYASSDLAGAILYGDVSGPLPAYTYPESGNSIYNNIARFTVRVPDAPNSKGILAGTTGVGLAGADSLIGNYWGRTDANLTMKIENRKPLKIEDLDGDGIYEDTTFYAPALMETFFVESDNSKDLRNETFLRFTYKYQVNAGGDPRNQGPFESIGKFDYEPVLLANQSTPYDENKVNDLSIPERLLMSGLVYDMFDKGTDIKVVDFSTRNMSPIEDFAVGIPPLLRRYTDASYPSGAPDAGNHTKYVRRWIRNPWNVDSLYGFDPAKPYAQFLRDVQDEFRPDTSGKFWHPVGYPLYLESRMNLDGLPEVSNNDSRLLNESVFYVINATTSDFIRVNMKQVTEEAPRNEILRARIELLPDSSNRNPDFTYRRSLEGLLTYGDILADLDRKPYNEQSATLPGRRYDEHYAQTAQGGPINRFGSIDGIFSNRPSMPVINSNDRQTFFVGERYNALPVNVGDVIRVISRTILWKEGGHAAWRDGLEFTVGESTVVPDFTHEIPHLQTDTVVKWAPSQYPWELDPLDPAPVLHEYRITDFLNKIFVTENRIYPWTEDQTRNGEQFSQRTILNGQGRDSILTVSALDGSKFYDPRSLLFGLDREFTQLTYKWNVASNSGLARWLQVDTIPAYADKNGGRTDADRANPTRTSDALGYLEFRGMPINPYVVPGGENVQVIVENYPPHYRSVDVLKELQNHNPPIIVSQDTLDMFINIFPKYLCAGKYDIPGARFLQQDTINSGKLYSKEYNFSLFVINQMPKFLELSEMANNPDLVKRRLDSYLINGISTNPTIETDADAYVIYLPTVYTCDKTTDGRLRANVTDKLRFQIDINTDDELEDNSITTKPYKGLPEWDFRYGKTAYGFLNISDRPFPEDATKGETDSIGIDDNYFSTWATVLNQVRPIWMQNDATHKYVYKYGTEDDVNWDQFGTNFQTKGQLNIRIPRADVLNESTGLLLPLPLEERYQRSYNTDTTMVVVVNDGHGGISTKEYPIFVNVAPQITNTTLPSAKEDIDYNPQLIDSAKRIKVYDPNFQQWHRFQLIYSDAVAGELGLTPLPDVLPKDPCYPEAGTWDIASMKNTPKWIRINGTSGLLFGTPGIKDAPRNVKVAVLVEDEDGLNDVKVFDMYVDSTNHLPRLYANPIVKCIDRGTPYSDTIRVVDKDLLRGIAPTENDSSWVEQLTITVDNGLTAEPSIIKGIKDNDTAMFVIKTDKFDPADRQIGGIVYVTVTVRDKANNETKLVYRLKISDPTDFVCPVTVANSKGGSQVIEFGTAERYATTGDDPQNGGLGTLDSIYCEYELPPIPHTDIFDVRWTVPTTNGILRNIYPRAKNGVSDYRVYKAIFQAGGVSGKTAPMYPVTISWDKTKVPAYQGNPNNPTGSTWHIKDATSNGAIFDYNMSTGDGMGAPDCNGAPDDLNPNIFKITITRDVVDAFIILHVWADDVEEPKAGITSETAINQISPNPFANSTNISFTLNSSNKIKMDVIDALGNVVAVLADAQYDAGQYTITWNGVGANGLPMASGTYTCRLVSGSVTSTYQMVIVK